MNFTTILPHLQSMFCPLKKPWILRLSTLSGDQAAQTEIVVLVYHQTRLQLQLVVVLLQTFAGIIGLTVRKLRTAVNPAPGQETSWPAGGILFSSCQRFKKLQPDLSTGFIKQAQISDRLRSFSVRFSLFEVIQL